MMLRRLFLYISFFVPLVVSAQNPVLQKRMDNALMDAVEDMNRGDCESALRLLKHIEEIDPSNDATAYFIGRCLYNLERYEDAIPYIQKAYMLDSLNTDYREFLAEAYVAAGRREEATPLLVQLYEQYPGLYSSPYILCVLGGKALEENNDSLARARYSEALEQDPDYAPAQLGMIDVSRFGTNIYAFISAVSAFVKNDLVEVDYRADYLMQIMKAVDQGIFDACGPQLDDMTDCLAADERCSSKSLEFAGQWFYGTGREEKGRGYFRKWAEKYPDSYDAQSVQMQFRIMDGDYQRALEICRVLERLAGKDRDKLIEVYTVTGDCLHELGEEKACFSYYKKVLRMDPEYVPVLNNYAYYLSLKGKDLVKAANMSRITVEKEPENSSYLDTYGWILFLQGKVEEARIYFKKAMVYGGRDSDVVMEHYSAVLRALGDNSTADYYHSLAEKKRAEQ